MGLGLALWPALAGFLLLTLARSSRYWAMRRSGHHLVFASAIAGMMLLVLARLLVVLLTGMFPGTETFWMSFAPFEYSGAVGLSFVLAATLGIGWNLCVARDAHQAAKQAALRAGDMVEWVLHHSAGSRKFVEVSLKSGKSYIGMARESGVSRRQVEPDITLIPLMSGYRDGKTRQLRITADHTNRIFALLDARPEFAGLTTEDLRVVVPMSEVSSARVFDPQIFRLSAASDEPA